MTEARQRGSVLVAGAINTDLVARTRKAPIAGETVTGQSFAIYGGGKGANQAVAAARFGARTTMLGALGRDTFGEQRLADLRADGIDTQWIERRDDASSGVALIVVEDGGENRIVYVPGATLMVEAEQAQAALRLCRPDVVLATLELPIPTLHAFLSEAKQSGKPVVMNAAPEPASGQELLAFCDVLIVNEVEARALLEAGAATDDWACVARALTRLGPRVVTITLGAAGAVVAANGSVQAIPAPVVEVVDTTGAGDAFCGAFAAALAQGQSAQAAARLAVVAGSLATTKHGAQPSIPTGDEIALNVARLS